MRILVTGFRDWPDDGSVETEIERVVRKAGIEVRAIYRSKSG